MVWSVLRQPLAKMPSKHGGFVARSAAAKAGGEFADVDAGAGDQASDAGGRRESVGCSQCNVSGGLGRGQVMGGEAHVHIPFGVKCGRLQGSLYQIRSLIDRVYGDLGLRCSECSRFN